MKKVIVLGAGMVGKAIAIDLSDDYEVKSVDINKQSLQFLADNYQIATEELDISDESELARAVYDYDLVISAVPGFLGFKTLKTLLNNRKNLVDISFLPENVLELNELAKEKKVTAIVDCGIAPGIPNLIAGYYNEIMKIEDFQYMVGGLPVVREFPFEYKAPFSPCDVMEEYTRPARFVENGEIVIKPAMSDLELVKFKNIGTLEAFNSDGLRSLIYTLGNIPNMKEKTLRFPGHVKMIQALQAAGFFEDKPIKVKGATVTPFDVTSEVLYKTWKLNPDDREFTLMKIIIKGTENNVKKEIIYDLHDVYDPIENLSSMARTTGFTATAAADMILNDVFNEKGVFPPELVGKHSDCFRYIMGYLQERNINYTKTE